MPVADNEYSLVSVCFLKGDNEEQPNSIEYSDQMSKEKVIEKFIKAIDGSDDGVRCTCEIHIGRHIEWTVNKAAECFSKSGMYSIYPMIYYLSHKKNVYSNGRCCHFEKELEKKVDEVKYEEQREYQRDYQKGVALIKSSIPGDYQKGVALIKMRIKEDEYTDSEEAQVT